MKKFNVKTGISAALLALSLVVTAIPANAAKLDASQIEVNQVGVAAPTISLKNTIQSGNAITGWTISFPALGKNQKILFNIYKGDEIKGSKTITWYGYDFNKETGDPQKFYARYSDCSISGTGVNETNIYANNYDLEPGDYSIVAYLYDGKAHNDAIYSYNILEEKDKADATDPEYRYYDYTSTASNAIPVKVEAATTDLKTKVVKASSIQLTFDSNLDATGYEVYRKEGKKFNKVATTTKRTYTDSGLVSDTAYTYKVRAYFVDKETKAVSYAAYAQIQATTKGSGMNLKINATGKKDKYLKLTWKKVAGATKYEIYRKVTDADDSDTVSKDNDIDFETYKLVKTLKKKATSYTDKKVSVDESYSYIVRAIVPGKNKKESYIVSDRESKSLLFGMPYINREYTDATGKKTVEWEKVYGATGYVLEKYDEAKNENVVVASYGASTTKLSVAAPIAEQITLPNGNKTWHTTDTYSLYALKGNAKSAPRTITVNANLGMVSSVTATKVENGINVSWTAVPNATYYHVYRVAEGAWTKNADTKGIDVDRYGEQVVNYVDVAAPVKVDVAAYNYQYKTAMGNWEQAGGKFADEPSICIAGTLSENPDYSYYYQNYKYRTSDIIGTSVLDYAGDIYTGTFASVNNWDSTTQKMTYKYANRPCELINNDKPETVGPKEGVAYQYYVVAVLEPTYASADEYAAEMTSNYVDDKVKWYEEHKGLKDPVYIETVYDDDFNVVTPGHTEYYDITDAYIAGLRNKYTEEFKKNNPTEKLTESYNNQTSELVVTPGSVDVAETPNLKPVYKEKNKLAQSVGCVKLGTATFTSATAPGKAAIKSAKSAKKKVTITIKKAANATSYKIYRSTKKKGKYVCVGTTTGTKFTDAGVEAKKTYYYKVAAVAENEAKADVESAVSAAKKVKAK